MLHQTEMRIQKLEEQVRLLKVELSQLRQKVWGNLGTIEK